MSILTIEQFEEFVEQNPEMEQFYDFRYDSETKDSTEGSIPGYEYDIDGVPIYQDFLEDD